MSSWLSNITGIRALMWGRSVSAVLVIAAVLAAVGITVFLYRKQRGLPGRVRFGLAAARLLVLLVAVLAIFEPAVVIERVKQIKRRLPVLIDVSRSMSIKDQRKRPKTWLMQLLFSGCCLRRQQVM